MNAEQKQKFAGIAVDFMEQVCIIVTAHSEKLVTSDKAMAAIGSIVIAAATMAEKLVPPCSPPAEGEPKPSAPSVAPFGGHVQDSEPVVESQADVSATN